MSRGALKCLVVIALVFGCGVLAKAGPQPADSVSGTLKANGNAGSGKLRLDVALTTTAKSDLKIEYFEWNGTAWQSHTTIIAPNYLGTFNLQVPFSGTSGKHYYAQMSIIRGNPPVAIVTSNSNSIMAP